MLRWFRRRTAEERARQALVGLIIAMLNDDSAWHEDQYVSGRTISDEALDINLRFDMWDNLEVIVGNTRVSLTDRQLRHIMKAEKARRDRRRAAAEKAAILDVRDKLHERAKLFSPTYSG